MLNKISQVGQAWSVNTTSFNTVVNQAEYVISSADSTHQIGKPLYAYRDLGSNDILPVPFTDYSQELMDQKHEFWNAPFGSAGWPNYNVDKIAFFRTSAGVMKARVYPIPTDVRTFYVTYAAGRRDWSQFAWSDVPILPEWSYFRQLKAAAFLLPDTEWSDILAGDYRVRRLEIGAAIKAEIDLEDLDQGFKDYLRDLMSAPIADVGYWDE